MPLDDRPPRSPAGPVIRPARLRRAARQAITTGQAVRAGRTRARRVRPVVPAVEGDALRGLLASVGADAHLTRITVNRPRWTATGLEVNAGDQVTWLAWGTAYAVRLLAIGVRPHFALGGRIQGGPVHEGSRDTFTFTAEVQGQLELASLFPGELRSDGTIATDTFPYRLMTGGFTAVVARWPPGTDVGAALAALAGRDPSGLCAAEARRLAAPPQPPPGWQHHPLLRPAETYSATERGMAVSVHDAVGIICRPADIELTPTVRLRWSWRVDQLPSRLAEDTTLTHDYLSVAVEFDDGRDLTWHWSAALPSGYTYHCPFAHWRHRETHIVVRSGPSDLGRWLDEERPILADHQAAIGGPAPARIVRAWLIACSFLQGNTGHAEIGDIAIVDGERNLRVL